MRTCAPIWVLALLLSAMVGTFFVAPVRAGVPTQNAVESSLTCQCGCGLTVHSCNHVNCGSAIPLKKEIGEQIGEGRDLPEILSHFEEKYGEVVLSAPTMRGFNLAAWVMPFVVLGLGGLTVGVVLWRWRGATRSDRSETPPVTPAPSDAESKLRERLERELRDRDV
ncbi:MAG: cytochrome c-type biogenesis protein CcmH [Candidatus Binatia bacterium]|nr:cytochrome c-type biogenesis protein CcmH [Candidatus Binatia bacterium]